MSIALWLAIYVVIWWVVLFAVLPFGVRTQEEEGEVAPGTAESAPARPLLARKIAATTLAAALLFACLFAVIEYRLIGLDDIPFLPRFDPGAGGR
jgi:predicted secreted protein